MRTKGYRHREHSVRWRIANAALPYAKWADNTLYHLQFHVAHHRRPRNSLSFNDVLYYIKTSSIIDLPLRRQISDKTLVKRYIAEQVGEAYNVPTVEILSSVDEAAKHAFVAGTVAKPTHGSGAVAVACEGSVRLPRWIYDWFGLDYYRMTRERNYRGLERRIIVEPLVFGSDAPLDFKFHCFRGRVVMVHVDFDRRTRHTRAFFTRGFQRLPFSIGYPVSSIPIERPRNLDEMIEVAERLARNFSFIRVDMYTDGKRAFVGEITNVHGNAHEPFFPVGAEREYGPRFFPDAMGASQLAVAF